MIVVLEGPDGAGKTHLAGQLAERFGLRVHHEGPPPVPQDQLYLYYVGVLFDAVMENMSGPGIVLDRFGLSETIYGVMYRGAEEGHFQREWKDLSSHLRRLDAVQILCLPPLETARRAWAGRQGEILTNEMTWLGVYSKYAGTISEQDYLYDWTVEGSLDRLVAALEEKR